MVEGENYVRVNELVKKPSVEEAPSNLAVIGRYVLHPAVFEVLENTRYEAMSTAVSPYGDCRAAARTVAAIAHLLGTGPSLDDFVS